MAYATLSQLQDLLKIPSPTVNQQEAMVRVLDAAAEEIDWELGYTSAAPAPDPPPPLVVEVNLNRAMEHWRQEQSPYGVIAIASESEPIITARNSWYRHRLKLKPLKVHQGVA